MKKIIISLLLLILAEDYIIARDYSLEECLNIAEKSSLYSNNSKLYNSNLDKEKDNLSTAYLPQVSFDAQATYQSDVMKLPINFPGIKVPEINKDQYQAGMTINQLIWDAGIVSTNKQMQDINFKINSSQNDSKILRIKESVTNLYFAIIQLQNSKKVLVQSLSTLTENRKIINSAVESGNMHRVNRNQIDIEISKIQQSISSINNDIIASKNALALWLNLEQDFELSLAQVPQINEKFERPELYTLKFNSELLEKSKSINNTIYFPKISAYFRLGYANPNPLNVFEKDASSFYNLGIKLSWAPFDWNNTQRKNEIATTNIEILNNEKQEIEKSLNIAIIKEKQDIQKYDDMLKSDENIIELQKTVVADKFLQFESGTINSSEYLSEFNKLNQFIINWEINKIKKLNAMYNIKLKYGI